jgi:RNA-binding protein
MPHIALTPAQRKEKRAAAHHLHPVVAIGSDGLTDAVVREIDAALAAHGLIKVRMFSDEREAREAALAALADRLDAAPVQHIGKLLVLWRTPRPKEREAIEDREGRGAGPRVVKIVKPPRKPGRRVLPKKVTVLGNQRVTSGGLVKRAKPKGPRSLKKSERG